MARDHLSVMLIAWKALLIVILASLSVYVLPAGAQPPGYGGNTPFILEFETQVDIRNLVLLNASRALLVGDLNGTDVVQVVDFSDPYRGVKVIQTYPLSGRVTAVASNGYPLERIAIGTDKGEVLLFKVDGGRIHLLLHLIQGADFYVSKLLVLKSLGTYKVVALVNEAGRGAQVPCITCHVYVFDENSTFALRIGPQVGNATESYELVYPQDIAAAMVISESGYYYDASRFAVAWVPYQEFYEISISITYLEDNDTVAASGALVHVLAYDPLRMVYFRYGVNADDEGRAQVLVPVGYMANFTIEDVNGKKYTIAFDPGEYFPGLRKIYFSLQLEAPPVTIPANLIYGVPEYLLAVIEILDLSNAPYEYSQVKVLDFKVNPAISGFNLLKGVGTEEYIMTYYDPSDGFTYLRTFDSSFNAVGTSRDYVGRETRVVHSFTFSSGRYVVVGFLDGRIKYYEKSGDVYFFDQEVHAGGNLRKITPLPRGEGYYLLAVSSAGVQIIRIDEFQLPYLRVDTEVSFSFTGLQDADALIDLGVFVTGGAERLLVGLNIGSLIFSSKPVDLNDYMAPSVTIVVKAPAGEDVTGTQVIIKYPGGEIVRSFTGEPITVNNLIPGMTYEIRVVPNLPYLREFSTSVVVEDYSDLIVEAYLEYKEYSVRLSVSDELSGDLIAPYTVLVDGEVLVASTTERFLDLLLLYGNKTITIRPADGFENVYEASGFSVFIDKDLELEVVLQRKEYEVEIVPVDPLSKELLAPLKVRVYNEFVDAEKVLGFGGTKVVFKLPYGTYKALMEPLRGYEGIYQPAAFTFNLTKPTILTPEISRVHHLLNATIRDVTAGILIGKFNVYVNGTKVLEKVGGNFSLTLPYGKYVIAIAPSEEYAKVYEVPKSITVTLSNYTEVEFSVARKYYNLKVLVVDDVGNPIKNAEVSVRSIDLGLTITTLLTDDNGEISTQLFYGAYNIEVRADGYVTQFKDVILDKDLEVSIQLAPQPITLLLRYFPIMVIVIVIAVAIALVLKLRSRILERLATEEEVF